MGILMHPFIIPLGAFVMVVAIVSIVMRHKERELGIERDLRIREMEHAKKMKEMDLEMARLKQDETPKVPSETQG